MSENTTEILVGGTVLVAAAVFLFFAGQVSGFSTEGGDYELTASFRSVEGVSVGTDVRLAGVKVGTVTGLELNKQTFRADTTVALRKGIEVPDDSSILISSEGLLGGNFVEIVPGGSPSNLGPGEEIEDTQGAVSLVSLLMKFVAGNGKE